ncbi:glycosyltransferase family 2 protein [Winogradskyella aurantiaca]|uniref:glycosyltransferase family 2 protein n=1 Tax=Winogradskyella aurantiaca TaxID=2219558 RepID=UPI000E1D99DC|nr:glycosyltransferase family 2 protein [Winogradskyella aurantiaca]
MKLSVIILNYNVSAFLQLCLQSVAKALDPIDGEIIVIDNNSTDDSCLMVETHFPQVVLIKNTENYGFSKGNNIGVRNAKGEFVCILNPDTVVPENCFTDLLKFAESKHELGAVGCQLLDGRGHFLPESKRNIPTPWVSFNKLMGLNQLYYHLDVLPDNTSECEILVGAFMLMKRGVYNKLGGFDEDFFMYGEDIDLSYRLLKAGYKNYYVGGTCVIHFKGESTLKDKNYTQRFYGAMQVFYNKHFNSNIFRDAVVSFGIKLAYLLRSREEDSGIVVDTVTVVSEKPIISEQIFDKEVTSVANIDSLNISPAAMIVLDSETLTFGSIIHFMKSHGLQKGLFFRIKPKNCKFILGSDHSSKRGTVTPIKS